MNNYFYLNFIFIIKIFLLFPYLSLINLVSYFLKSRKINHHLRSPFHKFNFSIISLNEQIIFDKLILILDDEFFQGTIPNLKNLNFLNIINYLLIFSINFYIYNLWFWKYNTIYYMQYAFFFRYSLYWYFFYKSWY